MVKTEKQVTKNKRKPKSTVRYERGGLSLKEQRFCELYTSGERDFFGNGTQSYIEAYDIDLREQGAYGRARAAAASLLANANVIKRVNDLLEAGSFNATNADKQLAFLMDQHADLFAKLGAVREFNKLKGRITEKMEHTVDAQAKQLLERLGKYIP